MLAVPRTRTAKVPLTWGFRGAGEGAPLLGGLPEGANDSGAYKWGKLVYTMGGYA